MNQIFVMSITMNLDRLFYNIPSLLLKRGMAEKEVAKIIGGNFLRVWGDVNNKI